MRGNATQDKIHRMMVELGRAVRSPGRIYFTGGVCAVQLGWRNATVDVDLKGGLIARTIQRNRTDVDPISSGECGST